ncbi:PREDICTED: tudor and KH domain-containing protein, partial [Phaethon lepturus]|uniref:tudor and KH domain-containing protein n=1 Tax=Phaethon lepturus TaxID=97097 RepID=UPI000530A690
MTAERGHWNNLTTLQKAAVVLGIPASAAILYILYRRYRESREERLTFVGDEELEIEVRVPRATVKSIIGRKGATIKKVRDAGVCRAKATIHQIVTESIPVSEQLCVPQRAVGRIIGRGGETVRGICRIPSPDFGFHADEHLEVYVSAAEHPHHFWIQIVGQRSLQLG